MFTSLLESYKEKGLKFLSSVAPIQEEPTEDEFNKEVDEAQKKSEGKIRKKEKEVPVKYNTQTAGLEDGTTCSACSESEEENSKKSMWGKPSSDYLSKGGRKEKITQAEKDEIDDRSQKSAEEIKKKTHTMRDGKVVSEDTEGSEEIQERTLTPEEQAKRERVVTALKRKMKSFKSRYGDKAKSVVYGVATNQAKK